MNHLQLQRCRKLVRISALSLVLSLLNPTTVIAQEAGLFDDPFVPLATVFDASVGQTATQVDQELLRRAEASYQRGRFDLAREQFGVIAAMNDHPFAWLRVGNIWHRQGRSSMAIDAYARAQRSAEAVDGHQGIAQRALKNLALLGLALTDRSLRAVGAGAADSTADRWTNEVRRRLVRLNASLPHPPAVTALPSGALPGHAGSRQEQARFNLSSRPARAAPSRKAGSGS